MNGEKEISSAVDCLTVVIESNHIHPEIRAVCEEARDLLINALLDIRTERVA